MTNDETFDTYMDRVEPDDEPEYDRVHKAAPHGSDVDHCTVCGQRIRRVPGGQGMTYVHADSGAVAAPNPPSADAAYERAMPRDSFGNYDPSDRLLNHLDEQH